MSDQPEPGAPPELTPAQQRTVTRLLAEARHDQPLPAEVAARLDDALGELSHADLEGVGEDLDDRSGAEGDGDHGPVVVDLVAHRRRRRNAGSLLLAAAAVIVVGVGVGQVISNGNDASDTSAASDQAVERGSAGSSSATRSAGAAPAPQGRAGAAPIELSGTDPSELAAQLTSQLASAGVSVPASPKSGSQQLAPLAQAGPDFTCASPPAGAYGAGELLPAHYDGTPVVLALRPTAVGGSTTQADVLECGTGAAVTTFALTLP